jgi:hypothetical protein
VECGAGTYIRSLARDLGEKLGCGAYLGALVRTASGPFRLPAAHSLDEIRAAAEVGPAALAALLLPVDAGLEAIPSVSLTAAEVIAVARGQQVKPLARPEAPSGARVRFLAEDGALIGVGSWKGGRLVPEKIFVGAPPSVAAAARAADVAAARTVDAAAGGAGARAAAGAATFTDGATHTTEPRLRIVDPRNRMTVVPGITALQPELGRLYLAVGVFDGLHRGHLYLLRELCRAARRAGARPAVITFDAHPEELIEGLAPPLLCDPDERLVRLQAAGIEVTVVQHFDHALRITPYDGFVAAIRERVDVAGFVMTPDAAFGFERGGTPETLAALGEREGFAVAVVPSFLSNGQQVRSSEIRRRIATGDLAGARSLLGRDHGFTGRLAVADVAPGASTPLIFDLPVALPPDGRYAAVVGPSWKVGRRPVPASIAATAVVEDGCVALEIAEDGGVSGEVRVVLPAPRDPDGWRP